MPPSGCKVIQQCHLCSAGERCVKLSFKFNADRQNKNTDETLMPLKGFLGGKSWHYNKPTADWQLCLDEYWLCVFGILMFHPRDLNSSLSIQRFQNTELIILKILFLSEILNELLSIGETK